MSYLHCPTCHRAYNISAQPACPFCPVHATPVDPAEDIVVAAERLAAALARASTAERGAAVARMDRLALPGPDGPAAAIPPSPCGQWLRPIRDALAPPPPPPAPRSHPLLQMIATAMWSRLEAHPRVHRAVLSVRARVRALAA